MADVIGKAIVEVGADTSNVSKDVKKSLGASFKQSLGIAGKGGRSLGERLGSALGTATKRTVQVGMAAVAGLIGASLVKGFKRLKALDEAKAKMRGLFSEAQVQGGIVDKVMKNVNTSVKGTAFGLGEAAGVAASAVAANIKPGKELTDHLTRIANNASAAGVSMDEMGHIFNQAATQANGVNNQIIQQLSKKGIPIYQKLGEQLGVTADEVFKMASNGKIDFETFSKAAEDAAGTVAAEMGTTFTGSLENLWAALGRAGANFLEGLYNKMAPTFQLMAEKLSVVEDKALQWGETFMGAINSVVTKIQEIDFAAFREKIQPLIDAVIRFKDRGMDSFESIGNVIEIVSGWVEPLIPLLAGLGGAAVIGALDAVSLAFDGITTAVEAVVGFIDDFNGAIKVVSGIIFTLFLPAMAKMLFATIVQKLETMYLSALMGKDFVMDLAKNAKAWIVSSLAVWKSVYAYIAQKVQLVASKVAMFATAIAIKAVTAAQWLWNAAMSMNPIGLIIIAIIALVAVIVILWKKSEKFREIVIKVWEAIKKAFVATIDWIKETALSVWESIKEGVTAFKDWIVNFFTGLWDSVVATFTTVKETLSAAVTAIWDGIKLVFTTAFEYLKAVVMFYIDAIVWVFENFIGGVKLIFGWFKTGVMIVVNAFINLYEKIKEWIGKALAIVNTIREKVTSVFKSAVTWLVSAGKNILTGLINGIKNFISKVISTVTSVKTRVMGFFKGAKNWLLDVGKDIMRGLRDGIDKGFNWIKDKISGVGKVLPGWLKKVLGISSPSKVMRDEIGQWLLPGVSEGLDSTIKPFRKNMVNALDLSNAGAVLPQIGGMRALNPLGGGADSRAQTPVSGGSTTSYGDISISLSLDSLGQLENLADLLKIIEQSRVNARKTQRSGYVTA